MFEMMAGRMVNVSLLETITKDNEESKVRKTYDEATQTVKTIVDGEPFRIVFRFTSGQDVVIGYKSDLDRDEAFRRLALGLGVHP